MPMKTTLDGIDSNAYNSTTERLNQNVTGSFDSPTLVLQSLKL